MNHWTLLLAVLALSGCVTKIDRYLVKRPISEALALPDPKLACTAANGTLPLSAALSSNDKTYRSRVILDTTAAMCIQYEAMEAELAAERAMKNLDGEARLIAVKDARNHERRLHTLAASRQWRAFNLLEQEMGVVGETCPKLNKPEDQLTWFIGILSGALALVEDMKGGGEIGVPMDTMRRVARGAQCLDDAQWWSVPSALEASVWAMVPGTAPEGVDAFEALHAAAERGDAAGMLMARGLQLNVSALSGRDDEVRKGLEALLEGQMNPPAAYVLLHTYAHDMAQHESDLLWTRATGHRGPGLTSLPPDDNPPETGSTVDPFGTDPFGADPFSSSESDSTTQPSPEPENR